ncbi:MAG: hypothetical protein O7A07_09645 [Acidobacteria bacterium]|nr:hypothetical protein [Acidobacteriota bacterium]
MGWGIRSQDRWAAASAAVLCVVLGVSLATVCCSSRSEMDQVIDRYIRAVQNLDAPRLAEVSAVPMAVEGEPGDRSPDQRLQLLETRLDQRFKAHLEQRDSGHFEFEPDGLILIQALGLGRGTYYETVTSRRTGPGRVELIQEVRLAYGSIDLSRLPRGTTIYLMGMPLGKVYHPVLGAGEAAARQLLERIWLRWDLVRGQGGWRVAGLTVADRPPEIYNDTTRY